ncbi:DNA methylase [Lawsonia intracellularis]|nr:DNA methylase [Lawsonia intracellularis]
MSYYRLIGTNLVYLLIILILFYPSPVVSQGSIELPPIEAFIAKWAPSGGSELGSSQSFLLELCDLLEISRPESPRATLVDNTYLFEMPVILTDKNGKITTGRIDLYKRGCFIWESKQGSYKSTSQNKGLHRRGTAIRGTHAWDAAMIAARIQAERYAYALPAKEGHPPFIIVADIGHTIQVYADFNDTGFYAPYPSARENTILLEDLRKPEIRERLRKIWTDPLSLNPSRENEKVTYQLVLTLSDLAQSLENEGHDPDVVALFIMRLIFTLFAEDCGLLPFNSYTQLLARLEKTPEQFASATTDVWKAMKTGGNSTALGKQVVCFHGHLFEDAEALPLNKEQLAIIYKAAKANWSGVETSIFGTLLERALSPKDRYKLGAHYTPTAYVERLVIPTVVDPVREDWENVKLLALSHVVKGSHKEAIQEIEVFHKRLSETIVLDPSCGSGNFLAVSMNVLKDIEGEVVQSLKDLGLSENEIQKKGYSITPKQFKGIEYNPRAAFISELVVWISYLQRHYKVYGNVQPPEPIMDNIQFIECRDAILTWDSIKKGKDSLGNIQETYINPRPADPWPKADFIVGNPPFIGNNRIRSALGDGYVEALRSAYPMLPKNIDYVMYWWHRSALLLRENKVRQFGFITTNSIKNPSNRKIVESYLENKPQLSIVMAIPDHPWTGAKDAARVRIAMITCSLGDKQGILYTSIHEKQQDGFVEVTFNSSQGKIHANLSVDVDTTKLVPLKANKGIAWSGVSIRGKHFIITLDEAKKLGLGTIPGLEKYIKPYMKGRDLAGISKNTYVIDLFGLSINEVQQNYPTIYQWIATKVKPIREKNRLAFRRNHWWLFGSQGIGLRNAINNFKQYIATPRTAGRRYFAFINKLVVPDDSLTVIASDDPYILGILSSKFHSVWLTVTATSRGLKPNTNDVYNKICFDTFPFPQATEQQKNRIRSIANMLDTHRKERQKQYPYLTLTHMYAIMEKVQHNVPLSSKESKISLQGDIYNLLRLHTELDEAVAEAYGWPKDIKTHEALSRLMELYNIQAEEEKAGIIHWLIPEYQKQYDGLVSISDYSQLTSMTKQFLPLFDMNIEKHIIKGNQYTN